MATLSYIRESIQSALVMKRVIDYCKQDFKVTDPDSGRKFVTGINCDGENSSTEFMATKKCFDKANGVYFYQYTQSFAPDEEITPEQAHQVAIEFAERAWRGHEVLVATHIDRDHIHSHFIINSVSFQDGSKLRQSPNTLKQLRTLNDEICQAHGLSILEPYTGGGTKISAREYRAAIKGESWKFRLMITIDSAMERSGNRDDFIREMEGKGYAVRWSDDRKYITYTTPDGMKCRDIKLHEAKYRKEMMEREFRYRTNQQGARPPESGERRTHGEDREGTGADSGDDTIRKAPRGDRAPENSFSVPAGAVQDDFPASDSGRTTETRRPDREFGKGLYEPNTAEFLEGMSAEDRPDEGDLRTGWEESRAVYFRLHSGAQSGMGQAQQGAGESQETRASNSDSNINHGNISVGSGILSALPRTRIIDDDSEDEEERRKRIQAEQNGADLGAAIGLAAGLIAQVLSSDDDEEDQYENEQEEPTQTQSM